MVLEDISKQAEWPTMEHGSRQISSKSSALVLVPKLLPGLLFMPGLYTVSGNKSFPLVVFTAAIDTLRQQCKPEVNAFLRQGLSLNLEPTDSAKLAGQQAPGITPFPAALG